MSDRICQQAPLTPGSGETFIALPCLYSHTRVGGSGSASLTRVGGWQVCVDLQTWLRCVFETGAHYVAQAGLTLWHPSCFAPQVLGLPACATVPSVYFIPMVSSTLPTSSAWYSQ